MPKLRCDCGYIHNLSNIPDDGYIVIKDKEYEELIETEQKRCLISDSVKEGTEEWDELIKFDAIVYKSIERLYECPNCGRLIWMRNDGKYCFYKLETNDSI